MADRCPKGLGWGGGIRGEGEGGPAEGGGVEAEQVAERAWGKKEREREWGHWRGGEGSARIAEHAAYIGREKYATLLVNVT